MPVKKKKSPRCKTSAKMIEAREREAKAVELRLKGFTFDTIAEMVGYADHGGAREAVVRALDRMIKPEDIEKYRSVQLARYEMLWQKHLEDWQSANSPEARAFAYQCLDRIANRIERVTGLAKDIQMNFTKNDTTINSYTVVEEFQKSDKFVDAEEYKQPKRQVMEYRGNGANGNGANGNGHE